MKLNKIYHQNSEKFLSSMIIDWILINNSDTDIKRTSLRAYAVLCSNRIDYVSNRQHYREK